MDYTDQFQDFCEAFADEMNHNNPLGFQVTPEQVKCMPEAIDAFLATLELVNAKVVCNG